MVDQRFRREHGQIDLLSDLDGVASIDEHGSLVGENDGAAGRTREPCQPSQSLRGRRNIFVLVLVGARHHETVEPPPLQFRPQGLEAARALRGIRGFLEGLEAGFEHGGPRRRLQTSRPPYRVPLPDKARASPTPQAIR